MFKSLEDSIKPKSRNLWMILTLGIGALILVSVFAFVGYTLFGNSISSLLGWGLTEKQEKAVNDSLAELKKLDAATEVGINRINFSMMLISAQAVTERAIRELPEGQLKQEISATLEAYQDANTLWNIRDESSFFFACPTQPDTTNMNRMTQTLIDLKCDRVGGTLVNKYKIPFRDLYTEELVDPKKVDEGGAMGAVSKKEGLSIIWSKASEHLNNISEQLGKK